MNMTYGLTLTPDLTWFKGGQINSRQGNSGWVSRNVLKSFAHSPHALFAE
jgi:hypothetical protein